MLAGLLNVSMMWLINGEGEGIGAPEDRQSMPEDINDILTEMRSLRTDLLKRAENLGRLEKRLRRALSDQVHG